MRKSQEPSLSLSLSLALSLSRDSGHREEENLRDKKDLQVSLKRGVSIFRKKLEFGVKINVNNNGLTHFILI